MCSCSWGRALICGITPCSHGVLPRLSVALFWCSSASCVVEAAGNDNGRITAGRALHGRRGVILGVEGGSSWGGRALHGRRGVILGVDGGSSWVGRALHGRRGVILGVDGGSSWVARRKRRCALQGRCGASLGVVGPSLLSAERECARALGGASAGCGDAARSPTISTESAGVSTSRACAAVSRGVVTGMGWALRIPVAPFRALHGREISADATAPVAAPTSSLVLSGAWSCAGGCAGVLMRGCRALKGRWIVEHASSCRRTRALKAR